MNSLNLMLPPQTSSKRPGTPGVSFGEERKLRLFVQKRVLNQDDADDIIQLTYLEAWRNQEKFKGLAKPDTWLCGIALNLIRNHFRRFYAQPPLSTFDESDFNESSEDIDLSELCDNRRLLDRTLSAMDALPKDMRETLWTAVDTESSYRDAAERLGVPIGTVRSRLFRAREQLKRSVYGEARP
ncbi:MULTISPECIES: RNA polymerase sigma factor [Pseudomonas]|jgi:RNA polymerase sigma factor (sigma-70 family)|uniref:RNA polymerase sigma factor n=1 Tax=Pseudomonas canavaninivorans TaxID=2842348 RepID=A0ABX8QD13_PSECO|nr:MULTISPECIES: RNA polymerase sigma factor [Pseudomonas]MBJ2347391.1 RNA polymerase sigma factor [Pseudomonas canavaninivorans]MBL3541164.1 RNA polymerase sigma factor [Pseudomonas sp. HB05]QXI53261.1 RNA polymerase sigma factor [Pseudomonas alvandae]UVM72303.1 RNA polymerase sigma factor [Pseudomonas canavaninivorans]